MIEIHRLESIFSSNCYIIKVDGKVYLVDPSIEVKEVLKVTDKLDGILITHFHFDHISTLDALFNKFKCKVYLHANSFELAKDAYNNASMLFGLDYVYDLDKYEHIFVNDKDKIDGIVSCIYAPGHTFDSIIYVIEDKMFTGDVLFDNSVGRSDLFSGDMDELYNTLRSLMHMNGDYYIYPGHGPASKLKKQAITNYYVRDALK